MGTSCLNLLSLSCSKIFKLPVAHRSRNIWNGWGKGGGGGGGGGREEKTSISFATEWMYNKLFIVWKHKRLL